MSLIPNVGATPPLPSVGYSTGGENRQAPPAPVSRGQRVDSPASLEQPRALAADEKPRVKVGQDQDKVEIGASRQLAAKSGLVEGSFEPFIDIIDPRYQTRIARVFGPDAGVTVPETAPVPRVVSKAYEAADGAAKTAFKKNA